VKEPPISPEPPDDKNQPQNQGQNIGGTLAAGGSKPPVSEEPPTNNSENHAQNSDSGGFGDSGGILPTPVETQQGTKANESGSSSSPVESNSIYRLGHSDIFACYNCRQRGDKWFMRKHLCTGGNDKLSL